MNTVMDIKSLRKTRGWTRSQMAEHFGVDVATISRWETKGVPQRGTSRMALEREFSADLQPSASPPSSEAA